MTALERRVNMAAVFIPFAVTAVAVALLWGDWVGWSDVVVFASDGGGTQYALATPAGSPVYRLPPDLVLDGVYTSEDPRFDMAAPDLSTFLDRLLQAVKTFAASSTPPSL